MSQSWDEAALKGGAATLCNQCAALKPDEKVLVLCNYGTLRVADYIVEAARLTAAHVTMHMIPGTSMHGQEPPQPTAQAMLEADVIFCLTQNSLAHSKARFHATERGARYLSLPDYSHEVLASPALRTNFQALAEEAKNLTKLLDRSKHVHIQSKKGTDLRFTIEGRKGNCAPGLVHTPGMLGSPPDAEVNIAPIENSCNGTFVVDGSIPCKEIGIFKEPVTLVFKQGRVVVISSNTAALSRTVGQLFDSAGPQSRVLGEFGIGLNPDAKLCGIMLIDEGARGTIHLGIGSNITIGGANDVAFHLDFVMKDATVTIDDVVVMEAGQIETISA